ncbi:MAG: hypothetical protein JNL34_09290 [Anaerolineae bacterium]|nr:hypothetical protein [Anaerolineae bacterium]
MQRAGHSSQVPANATKTPHPEPSPAPAEDALLQRALDGENATVFSPGVVRSLSSLVGNRAAQRMIQRAMGAVHLTTGRPVVQRDPSQAGTIANGHSYQKHVIDQAEFPGIADKTQFTTVVSGVMTSPDEKRNLSGGRVAYWKGDTVVIYNPAAGDKGTCFKPTRGKAYFDNLT